jgi:Na+/alanine symporter
MIEGSIVCCAVHVAVLQINLKLNNSKEKFNITTMMMILILNMLILLVIIDGISKVCSIGQTSMTGKMVCCILDR